MVVRKDIGLEAIGTMAELPPDHSPLQIGARGTCRDKRFKLLGRLRVRWEDGAWDEWYADFGGNSYGWVAETQGFFMISEAAPAQPALADAIKQLGAGQPVNLGGTEYRVSDIKQATAAGGEGELPFVAVPGETWQDTDLTGPGRAFAGVEWHEGEAQFFMGFSAMPDEVQWEGLKAVPGWNGEPVPVEKKMTQAMSCPNCGGVVEVRLAGVTTTLACSHCGSLIDVHKSRAEIGQKVLKAESLPQPPLALGKRGTLRGVEWEVLGCLWRKDPYVTWRELLLYNPWQGFAWLTESAGHWNFIKRIPDTPVGSGYDMRFGDKAYRLFDAQDTEVTQVAGEFYWRVRVGEKTSVADYIAPPYVLSSELYPELQELTWSTGEYVPADVIGGAFGQVLRSGDGVYLNAPNPWIERRGAFVKMGVVAVVVAIVLEALFSSFSHRRTVLDQNLIVQQPGVESAPSVSQTFELKGRRRADIDLKSDSNTALPNLTASLVGESTGTAYPVPVAVNPAQGSNNTMVGTSLPAVPAGKYHLTLSPLPSGTLPTEPVHVKIEQGGLFTSNFVICLLALLSWPAWAVYRYHRFEADRWSQSDYTP
ncbi:MAG: hypothetical protein JWO82_1654 [Akkermansiaceae bacterium]|nr:hypothetical protein [Akkermansiaceae bacterium]